MMPRIRLSKSGDTLPCRYFVELLSSIIVHSYALVFARAHTLTGRRAIGREVNAHDVVVAILALGERRPELPPRLAMATLASEPSAGAHASKRPQLSDGDVRWERVFRGLIAEASPLED
jgi:hypothetical protein